jgi:non-specific serine/threonine protein kinase/serine/threonine-protein kinase
MWRLYHDTLEQSPGARVAWLQARCDDEALRDQVLDLIDVGSEAAGFLDDSAIPDAASHSAAGHQIGPYHLERSLGEGGMGVVYQASQSAPFRRQVALKLIRPGLGSAEVLARFRAERQALALMDHPHIAKVFDAGVTADGRPYFVMELVSGTPLTTYADEHKLSTIARLQLLIHVLHAVQHAHRKGIVHRDIKPSNILVEERDGAPFPKIIDFGLAKALDESLAGAQYTSHGQLLGTPEFMSPEQACGSADIDTRTDVYSLGVVAYQLLSGSLPRNAVAARDAAPAGIHERLMGIDALRPSEQVRVLGHDARGPAARRGLGSTTLQRQLDGDLDWIIMKALDKDPARRYGSASEFADDLSRHLRLEPVSAGPPTARYRMQRFCRRNRLAVTTVAILTAGLALGAGGLVSGWHSTRSALATARAERDKATQVNAILEDVLASAAPEIAQGRDTTILHEILQAAGQRAMEAGDSHPDVAGDVLDTVATTYRSLGRPHDAATHAEAAIELLQQHGGPDHEQTLRAMATLALVRRDQGRLDDSLRIGQATLTRQTALMGPLHPDTMTTMNNVALVLKQLARYEEAHEMYAQLVSLRRAELGPNDRRTLISTNNLAATLESLGRMEDAIAVMESVLETHRTTYGPNDPDTLISSDVLGRLYCNVGRLDEAVALHRNALQGSRRVLGLDHPDTLAVQKHLADALTRLQRFDEAEQLLRDTLETLTSTLGRDHRYALYTRHALGRCLLQAEHLEEAHVVLEETRLAALLAFPDAHTFRSRMDLSLAEVLLRLGCTDDARALILPIAEQDQPRIQQLAADLIQEMDVIASANVSSM